MKYLRGEEELDEDQVDLERQNMQTENNQHTFNQTGMNFGKKKTRPGEGH